MHKQSMRWMAVAMSAVATRAIAQTVPPPSPPQPVTAAPSNSPGMPTGTASAATGPVPSEATSAASSSNISGQSSATVSSETTPTSAPATTVAPAAQSLATGNEKPWIEQLLPVDGLVELGGFIGIMFPSSSVNLQSQYAKHQSLSAAPELGVRAAYFPIKYVGGELEYMVGSSQTSIDSNSATLWALRAQVIGQYPVWRVTPFAALGFGRMGVLSSTMGNDGDPLFHFGVGAKAAITPTLSARFDLRDNMTQKYAASNGSQAHSIEVMIGISVVLGRPQEAPTVVDIDTDRDGLVDRVDRCPTEAGVAPDGCPLRDGDGDGVADREDKCPEVKGNLPDGCPLIKDSDGDGVPDDQDKCIETKGNPPDGCPPDKDSDDDGIVDSKDKCPNAPESFNGYEDTDGCPDELPTQVKDFTGVLKGIEFDREKATVSAGSLVALDKSAQVLIDYPSLRVLITGHTDDTGGREKNLQLSKARAEAVKAYFVSKGVDPARIETNGAGSAAPLDSNATAAGRQLNRRIELKLLKNAQ
jgi:outer membrane protein OmpA-like peptidoglycan-associated protein